MNHRAKFDAGSFILAGEIRNRTNKQTNKQKQTKKQTVNDISTPCSSACVDKKVHRLVLIVNDNTRKILVR